MKILWCAFDFMTAEPWLEGLRSLGHEIHVYHYMRHSERLLLDAADIFRPDATVYLGMAPWDKTPSPKTLARLRKICPTVHISGDLSDPPWFPFLEKYREHESFTRTVNIDGNPNWPSQSADLTLLSPTAPHFFRDQKPLSERPIPFGFAGSYSSPSRKEIIEYLVKNAGLRLKGYDHRYGTYQEYANFLMSCQIVPNVPISGSDAVRQVKGRVLECGEAGCVLLDHADSWAKHWFKPGVDYASYDNKEGAVAMAQYLLDSPKRMTDLAASLQRKVLTDHGPEKFWPKVLGGLT